MPGISKLVVVVPGLRGRRKDWEPLLKRLQDEHGLKEGIDARWIWWPHGPSVFAFGSARGVSRRLAAFINQAFDTKGNFDEVILVGHSMGGVFVRNAYMLGMRAYDTGGALNPVGWASRVRKFVLFASVNRGFDPTVGFSFRIGAALARLISVFRQMTIVDLIRGSDFITDLRLAWIRCFHHLEDHHEPMVIQFVGTRDSLVRREDSLDTEQFPNSETIDVPEAQHNDLYRLDCDDPEARYAQIATVFQPSYKPRFYLPAEVMPSPKEIVFVLHGIRAGNTGWVNQTCEIISEKFPNALPVPAQYGHFSAIHFFLPWVRRNRARWFQDRYSELAARFPDPGTKFYFIGHSNGTYMLGRGLENVSMMKFERAYIAGTVLPARYPWSERVRTGQVKQIRSDGSARDWPVGVLCSALSFMKDIGTGGFAGFQSTPAPNFSEFRYYKGGHSAPIEDRKNLEAIVDYVLEGKNHKPKELEDNPKTWFAILSRSLVFLGPVVLIGVLALLIYATSQLSLVPLILTVVGIFLLLVFLIAL